MKLPAFPYHATRHRQSGIAIIVVLALVVLVLLYLTGTLRAFHALGRELKLLDRQQTRRLQVLSTSTNSPAAQTNTNELNQSSAL